MHKNTVQRFSCWLLRDHWLTLLTLTSFHCCRQTHATNCNMADVLQTKVDAQCDKLATELKWATLATVDVSWRQSRKITDSNLPHLYFAPSFGVIPLEFCQDLWCQETADPVLPCSIVCMILCLAVLVGLWLVTDRWTDTAYTTLGWRHVVKMAVKMIYVCVWHT